MKLKNFSTLGVICTIPHLLIAKLIPTLNNDDNGVVCGLISAGKDSKVFFQIGQFAVEDVANLEEIKIPFALFRYSDTAFYNNFPEVEDYRLQYENSTESRLSLYDGLIDFDTNGFTIERNKISVDGFLPEPHIRTGYLEYRKDKEQRQLTKFEIDTSGMYCVLIAPPTDKGIKNLAIQVDYENSFGYLSVHEYIHYYNLKLSFVVGILILLCLHFILKKKEENISKGSIISIWIANYVLIPILIIHAISLAKLKNSSKYLNEVSMFEKANSIIGWIIKCLKIIITYYFPLLFSMGVGIIYLGKDSRAQLRNFPVLLNKKAKFLLYFHIIIVTITSIDLSSLGYINVEENMLAKLGMIKIASMILYILENIEWVLWLSFSIYYYFVTKKSISKFPAFEEPGVSKNITKAFRNSLLVINLTTFLSLIEAIFIYLRSAWSFASNIEALDKLIDESKVVSISQILVEEKLVSNFFSWSNTFFDDYIIIVSLFWIWLNHDKYINLKSKQIEGENFKS